MTGKTLEFYDAHAGEMTRRYDGMQLNESFDRPMQFIPDGCKLLEIGTGSGRDAARFLARGYDVAGIDGSKGMMREAVKLHPELDGRLFHHALPAPLPFGDASFQAVMSWAMIMHLSLSDISTVFEDIARILSVEGVFMYSVNSARGGLDKDKRDERGRRFTCLSRCEWEALHADAGFETIEAMETDDIGNRSGIRWVVFIAKKVAA
jgi:SAM-dependent methyltransferase